MKLSEVIDAIPISINYTISTIQGDIVDEGTGAFTANKVLTSSIILNLSISTNIEILGTVIVIPISTSTRCFKNYKLFCKQCRPYF